MEVGTFVIDLRIEGLESEEAAEELLRELIALAEERGGRMAGALVREADELEE